MVWNNFVLPRYVLQRHPLMVTAHFAVFAGADLCISARASYRRILPPGLAMDRVGDFGFVAIAHMVQTQLVAADACCAEGWDNLFFLAGYRIFVRLQAVAQEDIAGFVHFAVGYRTGV